MAIEVFFYFLSLFLSFLSNSDKSLFYKTNTVFSYVFVGSIVVNVSGKARADVKEGICRKSKRLVLISIGI